MSTPVPRTEVRPRLRLWRGGAVLQGLSAAATVIADWLVPTLVLLTMAAGSLVMRRRGPRTLGFRRPESWRRLATAMLLVTIAWTLLQQALVIPLANRVTGERQDMSGFSDLQ